MRVINHRNEVPREVKNYPQFQLFLIKVDDYPTVMLPLHQVTGFGTEIHGKTVLAVQKARGGNAFSGFKREAASSRLGSNPR